MHEHYDQLIAENARLRAEIDRSAARIHDLEGLIAAVGLALEDATERFRLALTRPEPEEN